MLTPAERADLILAQEYDWSEWDPKVRADIKALIVCEIEAAVEAAVGMERLNKFGLLDNEHRI